MIRIHEVVSRGSEAVLSDNGSNRVSGCFERVIRVCSFVVGSVVPLQVSGVLLGGRWLDYRRFGRDPLSG